MSTALHARPTPHKTPGPETPATAIRSRVRDVTCVPLAALASHHSPRTAKNSRGSEFSSSV